jgi:hypothetical protein
VAIIVSRGAHTSSEPKFWTGSFDRITVFHVEVGEDTSCILFLVDHEEAPIPPTSDAAAKQPFNVTVVSNGELVFELGRGKIGFNFGIGSNEEVVDAGS